MRFVLDASVAVAAHRPGERHHAVAWARVTRLLTEVDVAVVPSLFIAEFRGALARLGVNRAQGKRVVTALTQSPHEVVTLGPHAAASAGRIAARIKLRGSDSFYVWLAQREGIPLCTLDDEMAARGEAICDVMAP